MPEICTAITTCAGGGHHTLTVAGESLTMSSEELTPLSDEERLLLRKLTLRYRNIALGSMLNRLVVADEATNVKIYPFFGPGATITKTNIGTSYVNICLGLNGERLPVDLTGCTQYRFILHANVVGTGQLGVRVVRDSDLTVLHESANVGAAGEREGDTDWQTLPAVFQNAGIVFLRAQAKSTVGADDPVFRSLKLGLR